MLNEWLCESPYQLLRRKHFTYQMEYKEITLAPMPSVISFEVQGDPKGQPRPRAFARKFANGAVMARVYDPGTAEGWKAQIALAAKEHVPFPPLTGPVRLDIEFRFKRPKSHFLKTGLRSDAPFFHIGKPDRDNLEKAVMDALTTLGMWKDDGQVCVGEVKKIYDGCVEMINERGETCGLVMMGNGRPGATITITPLQTSFGVKAETEKQEALL